MTSTSLRNHPCRINGKAALLTCRAAGLLTAPEVALIVEKATRATGKARETMLERLGVSGLELTWVPDLED